MVVLTSEELALALVEHGITVHLVTRPAGGTLLVYLEEKFGEGEEAESIARGFSDVRSVTFSDTSKALMFVHT